MTWLQASIAWLTVAIATAAVVSGLLSFYYAYHRDWIAAIYWVGAYFMLTYREKK